MQHFGYIETTHRQVHPPPPPPGVHPISTCMGHRRMPPPHGMVMGVVHCYMAREVAAFCHRQKRVRLQRPPDVDADRGLARVSCTQLSTGWLGIYRPACAGEGARAVGIAGDTASTGLKACVVGLVL